jgi:hypothetical protein
MLNTRFWVVLGAIAVCAAARLIPHPPNMTPIVGMALFGGACFTNRKLAFLVPLAAVLLSDILLGLVQYGTVTFLFTPYVYGCYVAIVCLGLWIGPRRPPMRIATATLTASVLFYLVTNFGAWLAYPELYAQTWAGLMGSYVAGLPFFRNALIGDVACSLVLFGGFALAERYVAGLRETPAVQGQAAA